MKKILIGNVISNKMKNTVVVEVERLYVHPKYKRRFKMHKNYKAHTEEEIKIGERVTIEECPPISKDKRWKVIKRLTPQMEEIPAEIITKEPDQS